MSIVYREEMADIESAKSREIQIKHWTRAKKEALIRADVQSLKVLAKRRGA
jgi:predicted GIY-YIG superfamily endonuclease